MAAGAVPVRAAAATTPSTSAPTVVTGRRRVRRAARRRSRRLEKDVESERIEPVSREGRTVRVSPSDPRQRAQDGEPGMCFWTPPGRTASEHRNKTADPRRIARTRKRPVRPSVFVRAAWLASSCDGSTAGCAPPATAREARCVRLRCHTWVLPIWRARGIAQTIRFASTRGWSSPSGGPSPTAPGLGPTGTGVGARHHTQLGQPTT